MSIISPASVDPQVHSSIKESFKNCLIRGVDDIARILRTAGFNEQDSDDTAHLIFTNYISDFFLFLVRNKAAPGIGSNVGVIEIDTKEKAEEMMEMLKHMAQCSKGTIKN